MHQQAKRLLSALLSLAMMVSLCFPIMARAEENTTTLAVSEDGQTSTEDTQTSSEGAQISSEDTQTASEDTQTSTEDTESVSGNTGAVSWVLDRTTGTLTLSGDGATGNCSGQYDQPWND